MYVNSGMQLCLCVNVWMNDFDDELFEYEKLWYAILMVNLWEMLDVMLTSFGLGIVRD